MKKNFSIGWLFAVIAAVVVAALLFFSFNFQDVGEKVFVDVVLAAVIASLMLGCVFVLTLLKKVSIPLNFHKSAGVELFLLCIFIVGTVVVWCGTSHFYAVMERKSDIRKDVEAQISQMDEMFEDYNENVKNREEAYRAELESIKRNKNNNRAMYYREGLNDYDIETLVINNLTDKIACGDEMQTKIEKWENGLLSRTNGIRITFLIPGIREIDNQLNSTLEELKTKDRESEKGLNGAHWDYTLNVSDDIMSHFKKQEREGLNIIALIVSIITSFVMLLPYIAAERDGRSKGMLWEALHERVGAGKNNEDSCIGGI